MPVVGGIKGGMHKLEAKVRYRRGLCSGRRKEEPFGAIRGKNAHISYEEKTLTISYLGINLGWCCLVWGGSVDGANCACQR